MTQSNSDAKNVQSQEELFSVPKLAISQLIGLDVDDAILGNALDTSVQNQIAQSDATVRMVAPFTGEGLQDHHAGNEAQPVTEKLDIREILGDHTPPDVTGGYLNFALENGSVMLGINFAGNNSSAGMPCVQLAMIDGVSGLSGNQILNTLLANHEIKFD